MHNWHGGLIIIIIIIYSYAHPHKMALPDKCHSTYNVKSSHNKVKSIH